MDKGRKTDPEHVQKDNVSEVTNFVMNKTQCPKETSVCSMCFHFNMYDFCGVFLYPQDSI